MINRIQYLLVVVLFVSIAFVSCKEEPNLSGEWRCESRSHSAVITQDGNTYRVNMHFHIGDGRYSDQILSGKYENGEIKIDPTHGTLKYSLKGDRLYFHGDEFVRVVQQNKI